MLSFDVEMFCYHFPHNLFLLKTLHTHNYAKNYFSRKQQNFEFLKKFPEI